jgi:hypothetical protein
VTKENPAFGAGTHRRDGVPEYVPRELRTVGKKMRIEILGTESLGVRGLSCVVWVDGRKIVIDPGLALGQRRHGLLPHPAQVAIAETVRRWILAEPEDATDVVMSHFHGDHVPSPDVNPYQLSAQRVAPLCRRARFWAQ